MIGAQTVPDLNEIPASLPHGGSLAADDATTRKGLHWDQWILLALITFFNLHLLGFPVPPQVFLPEAVSSGQWWRLLTHPFVHVSWYHLLLDAGAFWLLYTGLDERRTRWRIGYALVCGTFSLATAFLTAPVVALQGLCGLSGTAHGLTAVSAAELMRRPDSRLAGAVCLAVLVAKSATEAVTGRVVLDFLHMGLCGSPVAVCHAGGVLGGLAAFGLVHWWQRRRAD